MAEKIPVSSTLYQSSPVSQLFSCPKAELPSILGTPMM